MDESEGIMPSEGVPQGRADTVRSGSRGNTKEGDLIETAARAHRGLSCGEMLVQGSKLPLSQQRVL